MARAKRGAPKATKAVTEDTEQAPEAPQAPEQAPEAPEAPEVAEAPEAPRLTSRERELVAVDVLDAALVEIRRRLTEDPKSVQASTFAETVKLLGLWFRFKERIAKDDPAEDYRALLGDLPQFEDDDADDPLLQGNRDQDRDQEPVVSPADIAALAKFAY